MALLTLTMLKRLIMAAKKVNCEHTKSRRVNRITTPFPPEDDDDNAD
jgi:hypothetical protein